MSALKLLIIGGLVVLNVTLLGMLLVRRQSATNPNVPRVSANETPVLSTPTPLPEEVIDLVKLPQTPWEQIAAGVAKDRAKYNLPDDGRHPDAEPNFFFVYEPGHGGYTLYCPAQDAWATEAMARMKVKGREVLAWGALVRADYKPYETYPSREGILEPKGLLRFVLWVREEDKVVLAQTNARNFLPPSLMQYEGAFKIMGRDLLELGSPAALMTPGITPDFTEFGKKILATFNVQNLAICGGPPD